MISEIHKIKKIICECENHCSLNTLDVKNGVGRDFSIGDAKAAKTVSMNPTKMNMDSTDSLGTRTADGDGPITATSGGVSVPFPGPVGNISSVS